jgi:hypothetical protein
MAMPPAQLQKQSQSFSPVFADLVVTDGDIDSYVARPLVAFSAFSFLFLSLQYYTAHSACHAKTHTHTHTGA